MKAGIYPDVPARDYHTGPGISKSGLDLIHRSGAHYRAKYPETMVVPDDWQPDEEADDDVPFEDAGGLDEGKSRSLVLGTAIHTLFLEPHQWGRRYVAPKEFSGKGSREAKAQFNAQLRGQGLRVITPQMKEILKGIKDSLARKPKIKRLLDLPGASEVSYYCPCPLTGALRKVRVDRMTDSGIIIDLKSGYDLSPEGFSRAIQRYRYHVSQAYYTDVVSDTMRAVGSSLKVKGYVFIAMETRPPYEVAAYSLDEESVEIGRAEYQADIREYARMLRDNDFSGYPDRVLDISLPQWRIRQYQMSDQ